MSVEVTDRAAKRLWRNRDFRTLMFGETVSEFGNTVGTFALPLVVVIGTGSAFYAGVVVAAGMAGSMLCSVFAGAWVDSHSRRNVMLLSLAIRITTWTILGTTLLVSTVNLYLFIPLGFAGGVASALFRSAEAGALKVVVPPADYPRAAAVVEGRGAAADLGGAPLGGLLVGLSTYVPFFFNAMTFVASLVSLLMVRADLGKPTVPDVRTFLNRVTDGYRYIWRRTAYRSLILTATLSNFSINAFNFSLILILQRQQYDLWQIGLVQTGTAVGALLGVLFAGPIVDRLKISTTVVLASVLRLAALVGVTLWHDRLVVVIILMAIGVMLTPAANSAEGAYMAITTPSNFQGRVASFNQLIGSSLIPLTPIVAGALLATLHPTVVLSVLSAISGIALVAIISSRAIRGLPRVSSLEEVH